MFGVIVEQALSICRPLHVGIEADQRLIQFSLPLSLNELVFVDNADLVMEGILDLLVEALADSLVIISSKSVDVDEISVVVLGETLGSIGKDNQLHYEMFTFLSPSIP